MAISTGILPASPRQASATPTGLPVRGRDLDGVRPATRPLGATLAQEQSLRALQRWEAMRGQVLVRVPVIVVGAFPGSLLQEQMLERADLTVSEFYFAIDEGAEHGFAIPADDIVDLTIVPDPAGNMRALRIRYVADHTDGCIQAFTIATTGFRRVSRFKTILRLAAAADIQVEAFDPGASRARSLAITWAHVRRFSNELMVWSGTACGPVGGWLASARAECRVWMTTHSFFWCDVAGEGVNRLPVADILDVTMDLGAETPVVALALRDAEGCRQEIFFGFDRREFGDRAESTCRSLVAALHEYGVATRTAALAFAPWLPGHLHEMPRTESTNRGARLTQQQVTTSPAARAETAPLDETMPAEVLAWLAMMDGPPMQEHAPRVDSGVAAPDSGSTTDATLPTMIEVEVPADTPAVAAEPWTRMSAFENACLADVRSLEAGTATPAHSDGTPSLPDALTALSTLIEAGEIELLDANARAQRMRGLAECRTSLRTLAHQQQTGIRARSAILTERRGILARVVSLTAGMDDARVPTAIP